MPAPRTDLVELATEPRIFVFDINVWMATADLLGPFAGPDERHRVDEATRKRPVPDREQPAIDSYRTWRMGASGVFIGPIAAEVLISEYMLDTLWTKLIQSPGARIEEDRGLGWSQEEASHFIADGVMSFAKTPTDDGFREPAGPEQCGRPGAPALRQREDGMVLACALAVGAHYLVTSDSDFDAVRGDPRVRSTLEIVQPGVLVQRIRRYGGRP